VLAPVYLAAAIVPQGGLFRGREYRDVGLYGDYARGLLDGQVPYRDFFVEYPPGAFAVFTPPALLPEGDYRHAFKILMALLGVGMLVVAALILVRLGASSRRLYGTLAVLALVPLALGPVSLNTYDAWPALLVGAAACALLYRRPTLGFALLGLAVTAKLYPVALLPLFCFAVRDRLRRPLLAFGAVVAVVFVPFAVVGWDGLWESFQAQGERALQLESLGGAILLAAHRLGLYDATVVGGSTAALSRDLAGALPDAVAVGSSVLEVAAILTVAWVFVARGGGNAERLVVAAAATLVGFLAFSRFISPQYLVWLLPLVPISSAAAAALLAAAMVLAQLWFFHYRDVFALDGIVWLVVARDLVLVVLYGVLVAALLRLSTKTPSSSSTLDQASLSNSRPSGTAVVEGEDRRSR
jgi:glycosyl transferase family 87